jgi:hypothetical protein
MKGSAGKRLLLLLGGLGALIAATGVWTSSESPDWILAAALGGIGLILLAWMQFGEEFRKR